MRRVKFKVVSIDSEGKRHSAFTRGNYNLDYPENSIVRAREGTLGVAVFKTRRQAEMFLTGRRKLVVLRIIRVYPVGRGRNVKFVCDYPMESALDNFYNAEEDERLYIPMKPPPGTIFYPAVEVIE